MKKNDLIEALTQFELWGYLARQDIKARYRRSKIGPFWITISMAIFCGALGVVYSRLFGVEIAELLPFISIGMVAWSLLAGVIGEMPNLYVDAAQYIKNMKINLITVLFRSVEKNLIIFFHNLVIVIGIYVYFGIWPGWVGLIVIPGFLLVLMNLLVIGLPLAILGARFRDVAQITQSLLQVIFFLTPIFWFPNSLSKDSWIILLNPATHYIDLIRSPLLGQYPTLNSWAISIFIFITSLVVAIWAYRSKKQQVVFWI